MTLFWKLLYWIGITAKYTNYGDHSVISANLLVNDNDILTIFGVSYGKSDSKYILIYIICIYFIYFSFSIIKLFINRIYFFSFRSEEHCPNSKDLSKDRIID